MRIFIYMWEGIKIAFEALRSYKLRSILTTLGIIIGVTTVITIVSLIQGLNKAFSDQISSIGTDTLYIQKFPWIMKGDEWFRYRNRKNVSIQEAEAVRESATLARAVAPTMGTMRSIKYNENTINRVYVLGTTAEYLVTSNSYPEIGRFLSENDVQHNRAVCVIGSAVAEKLFPRTDPIGKRVNVAGRKFRVIGVLEKKGSFLVGTWIHLRSYRSARFNRLSAPSGVQWRSKSRYNHPRLSKMRRSS